MKHKSYMLVAACVVWQGHRVVADCNVSLNLRVSPAVVVPGSVPSIGEIRLGTGDVKPGDWIELDFFNLGLDCGPGSGDQTCFPEPRTSCLDLGAVTTFLGVTDTTCQYEDVVTGGDGDGSCEVEVNPNETCRQVCWVASVDGLDANLIRLTSHEGRCHLSGNACCANGDCPAGQTCILTERPLRLSSDSLAADCIVNFAFTIDDLPRVCSDSGESCLLDGDCPIGEMCETLSAISHVAGLCGNCDNLDPVVSVAQSDTTFFPAVEIEKTCVAPDPNQGGGNPIEIRVRNPGPPLMVDPEPLALIGCSLVDEIFLADPDCPADEPGLVGTTVPLTSHPQGAADPDNFNLAPNQELIFRGLGPALTMGDACNEATVICGVAGSFVTATDDDLCECLPANLWIRKYDTDNNPMAGVAFTVTGGSCAPGDALPTGCLCVNVVQGVGTVQCMCNTNAAGECQLNGLPPETYIIDEPNPPAGYEFVDCEDEDLVTPGVQVVLACGELDIVACTNCLLPSVKFTKRETPVSPATVGPLMPNVTMVLDPVAAGAANRMCTTAASPPAQLGMCTIPTLPLGCYNILEPVPPAGYRFERCVLPGTTTPITQVCLDEADCGDTINLECTNCPLPDLRIIKRDTSVPPLLLPGAGFTVRGGTCQAATPLPSGCSCVAGVVQCSCVTNASGECNFANLPPGTYTVDEPTPPAGYEFLDCLPDENLTTPGVQVVLACGVDKTVSCRNCELPDVKFTKLDSVTRLPMSNVLLRLDPVAAGQPNRECTTAASPPAQLGMCTIPSLPLDCYNIIEPAPPAGYRFDRCVLAGTTTPITQICLDEFDCGDTISVECTNCPLPDLRIIKRDTSVPPLLLPGVSFTVRGGTCQAATPLPSGCACVAGVVQCTCVTNASGECNFANLPPGTYTVDEPNPPVGYDFVDCVTDELPGTPGVQAVLTCNGATKTITCRNCELPDVKLTKRDTLGNLMPNVLLQLDPDPADPQNRVGCTTANTALGSPDRGMCTIPGLPLDCYTILEPIPPVGYRFERCVRTGTTTSITQLCLGEDECGDIVGVDCINCELPDLRITKQRIVEDEVPTIHAGVTLEVSQLTGTQCSATTPLPAGCTCESNFVQCSCVTDMAGQCNFLNLPPGTYRVTEANPTDGSVFHGCTPSPANLTCGGGMASVLCTNVIRCGDGAINQETPPEYCDGLDFADGVMCTQPCRPDGHQFECTCCGDGVVQAGTNPTRPLETCDPATTLMPPNNNPCRNNCTFCGDGFVDPGESCDDKNTNNDDGCRNDCTTPDDCKEPCPPVTKAKFDIWNENERRFSGTERCISSWDQTMLSNYTEGSARNHFLRTFLQTNRGKARIDGMASTVCAGIANATIGGNSSYDAPLLGLAIRELVFNDQQRTTASSELVGMGNQPGIILHDLSDGPPGGSLTDGRGIDRVTRSSGKVSSPASPVLRADAQPGVVSGSDPALLFGRSSASQKGSLLVFTKIEIKWDSAGNLIQDTFIELTNDNDLPVSIQGYLVHGDVCTWVDTVFSLTMDQPIYWSALTGNPAGASPFTVLGDGCPDDDPMNPGGRRLRGYFLAWAVNGITGQEIKWNHLTGSATIVNYRDTSAWEYGPWAFQAVYDVPEGTVLAAPYGVLMLDNFEYQAAPDMLLMDFFASGAQFFNGSQSFSVDTDLTLWAVLKDLRQDPSLSP